MSAHWMATATVLSALVGCSTPDAAPRASVGGVSQQDRPTVGALLSSSPYKEAEALYPVPKDTKLYELKRTLEAQASSVLPPKDSEDTSKLPLWFRVYFRKLQQREHVDPPMPTSGPYQYPRTANRLLQRLLDNPNEIDVPDPGSI